MDDLLQRSRLVTLTGPGGMGKTRLALRVAARVADRYADGVWFVELATLADPAGLPQVVAAVMPGRDLRADFGSGVDVAALVGDQSLMLVLDNCEHLGVDCAALVDVLLRSCPALTVLTTSREALGIVGEQTSPLGPLSLPDDHELSVDGVAATEAGELFLQRATECSPGFALTEANAPVVSEICNRLDGMPLAIELAAARLTSLSPVEILGRLDDRFRLLTTGSRTVVARHQTLSAALEWSHDLLSPSEAMLLRRVSVFRGWTLAAAEEVCADDELDKARAVDDLTALVVKSLVVVEPGDAVNRFRLLETIRAWAGAKLEASPEADEVRRRHAEWCVGLAERTAEKLEGRRPGPWLDLLDAENDNFRAGLEWARATGNVELGLRMATALTMFWRLRGHIREGVRWLDWASAAPDDCPADLRAAALRGAGLLRGLSGDIAGAIPLLERSSSLFAHEGHDGESVCTCNPMFLMFRNPRAAIPELESRADVCRAGGDTNRLAHLVFTCGQAWFFLGDASEARPRFEEAVRLGRGMADGEALRCGLLGLGRVDMLVGDYVVAEAHVSEARVMAEDDGDIDDTATALGMLGDLARARGQCDRARELLDEAVRLARNEGSPLLVGRCLMFLARLVEWEGDDAGEAAELFEESLSLARRGGGLGFQEVRCLLGIGSAAQFHGDLSVATERFLEALEKAQSMGDRQGTALALDSLAGLARTQGDDDQARTLAHRGLELHRDIGELPAIAAALESLAAPAVDGQRWEPATRLLGAAQTLRDQNAFGRSRRDQSQWDATVGRAREEMGQEAFDAAWADGTGLTPEGAVAYAMRGRGPRDRPSSGWESLTPAERNVVRLVAEGLSDREVAQRLFISPRTVGTHLTHVYDKVGLRSRGALIKELAGREL